MKSSEKKAVKGKEIINEDRKNAEILNNFYQMQSKILNFQNIRKDNILQMKFLVQYSMQLWNSVIQTLRYRRKKCERWSKIQIVLSELRVSDEWVTSDWVLKMLKTKDSDIFWKCICDFFNECVGKGNSSSILKLANVTPVFKIG